MILSAKFAHPSKANILVTYEDGVRNVTQDDNNAEFEAVFVWADQPGNFISPFVAPASPLLSYTILSARYIIEDETAAIAETAEAGSVVYEKRNADEWAKLDNVVIAPYVDPNEGN